MVEYARIITKSSEGPPTIPPSASHDNGDWSANDIYENELYVDSLTGYIYTRKADTIVLVSTTGVDFEVIHDTTLTGNGTLADPLGVNISPSADNAIESTADGLFVQEGVPYVGATTNVDLGEHQIKAGQVEFDQTPTGTTGVAKLRWNENDGTLDLGLKGGNVTLQIGQEQVKRVVNKTGANLLESDYRVVRTRLVSEGGAAGQRLAVVLAQADSDTNSATTIGIVTENITNNQEGFITVSGEVRNINTTGSLQGETWVDGDILYLSPSSPGHLTNIKPVAPRHMVTIGQVAYAHAVNGKIDVAVQNGYELEELHDVTTEDYADPQDEDSFLFLDEVQQLWKRLRFDTLRNALQTAFNAIYQAVLVSGTNIKTINGSSILGSGDFLTIPQLTTAQRDALTPVAGYPIYNTTEGYLEIYDNFWGWMPVAGQNEWKRKWGFEHFNDGCSSDGTLGTGVFGSATVNQGANLLGANRPGNATLITGTTTNSGCRVFSASVYMFGGGKVVHEIAVQVATLSTLADRYVLHCGIHDVLGINQTDAVCFIYDEGGLSSGSAASPNFQCLTASNNVRTWTTTSVPFSGYRKVRVELNENATEARFYIDDILVATHTTNIPVGSARSSGWGASMTKHTGTTSVQTVAIDYISYKTKFTTPR